MKIKNSTIKLLYSIGIFSVVFFVLGFAVDKIWFREDDLGTILNGLIYNLHDFIRVFSVDCRTFITSVNYTRTAPNVLSAFFRPMQNVFFSLIHWFCGVNANAYFLIHVGLHALNATLFFLVCSLFMPAGISCIASLLFALYPDVSWLMWIATVQNSLVLMFVFLSVLTFYRYWATGLYRWYLFSGFLFFCSLLSRENAVFLPGWVFVGACMVPSFFSVSKTGILEKYGFVAVLVRGMQRTWIFFVAFFVYAFIRLIVFGTDTLSRTANRLLLLAQQTAMPPAFFDNAQHAKALTSSSVAQQVSLLDAFLGWLGNVQVAAANACRSWCEVLFKFSPHNTTTWLLFFLIMFMLVGFFVHAYKNKMVLLVWLFFGMGLLMWPGVVTYPNARYLNCVFPIFIFIIAYGVSLLLTKENIFLRNTLFSGVLVLAAWVGAIGVQENRSVLYQTGLARHNYKARFDAFFAQNNFSQINRFVILSSPFISDVQNIFRAYMGTNVDVVCEPFTTLADHGCMGCKYDYKVIGVPSSVQLEGNQLRLQSLDNKHCGWWLRFSDLPIVWDGKQRTYNWSAEQYHQGQWYACSMGKFKINQLIDGDCASDLSFEIDSKWIDDKTVFVAWNTQQGHYYVVKPT